MEKEKNVVHVTFSRPGVVKNILSRSALTLDGRTLDVSASQEVWDGKSIEVRGLKSSTTHDTVELFFKDFRRSGGGSLEYVHIDRENNVAHLVFEQPEVARMVLSKHTLNLEGATLAAQQSMYVIEWHQRKIDKDSARRDHVTEEPAVLEELQESLDPLDNMHTIHVKGFSQFTSFGALSCHFEDKHSSGGGDIEKMEKEKGVIHVTFSRPRVAKRVIS
ncbi:hypothetical protein LSAT2_006997 [Lamellibrachia satsuma]|nr:hypothetical protein LSAT2_006997 [Lamellibrachia satsuma]